MGGTVALRSVNNKISGELQFCSYLIQTCPTPPPFCPLTPILPSHTHSALSPAFCPPTPILSSQLWTILPSNPNSFLLPPFLPLAPILTPLTPILPSRPHSALWPPFCPLAPVLTPSPHIWPGPLARLGPGRQGRFYHEEALLHALLAVLVEQVSRLQQNLIKVDLQTEEEK